MGSIRAIGLGKTFPGVVALRDVDLTVHGGTVHALVGANGAGKSTLIKILTGFYPEYQGRIEIDDRPISVTRPADALKQGIEVVHQEVDTTLIPYLSVAENLLIEKLASNKTGPFIRMSQLYKEARQIADHLGLDIDVRQHVENLSLHQKQLLVIARALSRRVAYLILDEPTSSLGLSEIDHLFDLLRRLKQQGVGIIYVSHRLIEVREIADEVSVLRNGQKVAHWSGELVLPQIVEAMLGMPPDEAFPPKSEHARGDVVLEARGLTQHGCVEGVSLQVHRGEILGITGLTGAGKTELLHLLFGSTKPDAGEILVDGRSVRFHRPGNAIAQGIFLIPEERRRQGLLVEDSVRANISLPFLKLFCTLGWVLRPREQAHARRIVKQVGLIPPEPEMKVKNLSGGNQQKVVIGKWLGREPRVMLFDEATQGIDVGAKREIYNLARRMADRAGVVFASSEIDEVLGLADRVLVMRDGCIVAEFSASAANRQAVLEYATGARA